MRSVLCVALFAFGLAGLTGCGGSDDKPKSGGEAVKPENSGVEKLPKGRPKAPPQ